MSASKKSKGTLIVIAIPVVIILVILANSLFLNLTVRLVPESPDKIVISNPYLEQSAEITDPDEIKEVVDEINSSTIVCLSVFGLPTHPESGNYRRMTFFYGDSELTCRFDGTTLSRMSAERRRFSSSWELRSMGLSENLIPPADFSGARRARCPCT